jgi:hypothetical protein
MEFQLFGLRNGVGAFGVCEVDFAWRFSAMHLSPDEVLAQCSNCGAWPMAAKAVETGVSWGRLVFRCPRCHRDETRSLAAAKA